MSERLRSLEIVTYNPENALNAPQRQASVPKPPFIEPGKTSASRNPRKPYLEKLPSNGPTVSLNVRIPVFVDDELRALKGRLGGEYSIRDIVAAGIAEIAKRYP